MTVDVNGSGNIAAGGNIHIALEQIRQSPNVPAAIARVNEYREAARERLAALGYRKMAFDFLWFGSILGGAVAATKLQTLWILLIGVAGFFYGWTKMRHEVKKMQETKAWLNLLNEVAESIVKEALIHEALNAGEN